jgi:recombination protein RecA
MTQDNAEGSSRSALGLSQKQQAVLAGTLLGDGCLVRHGRNCRLFIKQKAAHRSLVEFKYEVFRDFVSMRIHEFDQRLGAKRYPCMQFVTRTNALFNEWRDRFYRDGRKVVPIDVARLLSPLAMAVWFMDDGAADFAGATLQTHNFMPEEVDVLADAVRERFDLAVSSRANRGKRILYVKAAEMDRLREVVEPYLLPEFTYKLIPRRARTP